MVGPRAERSEAKGENFKESICVSICPTIQELHVPSQLALCLATRKGNQRSSQGPALVLTQKGNWLHCKIRAEGP